MATTTKTFLNKPENLFTDQSRQVDILFWILIFTLYFIDFKDSRKEELFALCLATVNVGLGAAIAYVHYMLVRLLLEKKVFPMPSLGREKVEVVHKGRTTVKYYPTLYQKKKYHLNILFPVYFILTIGLIVLDANLYNVWGNKIAKEIKPIIDVIHFDARQMKVDIVMEHFQKTDAAFNFFDFNTVSEQMKIIMDTRSSEMKAFLNSDKAFKLPELTWTSNIPEATMIIYVFTGIMYALRYHRQHIETNIVRKRNELEIAALRWQLKPHTLFASLNSLYHAVDEADREKGLRIVKLITKMTSYIIDQGSYYKPSVGETDEKEINHVPLSKEIEFLKNFIELKQFEKGHKTSHVRFNVAPFDSEYHITPMILICYVENAFKHGLDKDKELKRPILIDIKMEQNTLYLTVFNHKPTISQSVDQGILKKIRQENQGYRTTSMGIKATKKLLEAAYPNQYTLNEPEENERSTYYEVKLTIKLNKEKI